MMTASIRDWKTPMWCWSGVSRTSKTPTSIYLADRGIRTANVPLVPSIPIPHQLETLKKPLVVSLHATPECLIQVRQNRLLSMGDHDNDTISIVRPLPTRSLSRGD